MVWKTARLIHLTYVYTVTIECHSKTSKFDQPSSERYDSVSLSQKITISIILDWLWQYKETIIPPLKINIHKFTEFCLHIKSFNYQMKQPLLLDIIWNGFFFASVANYITMQSAIWIKFCKVSIGMDPTLT